MNAAAIEQFGDMRGKRITQIVEPAYAAQAREQFAAKMIGTSEATEATAGHPHCGRAEGRGRHQLGPAGIERHGCRGLGLADPTHEPTVPAAESPQLTPRQLDVLRYLAAGRSTAQIAERLGISNETVRNHVRGIMQRLGVHSRLEAVLRAHHVGPRLSRKMTHLGHDAEEPDPRTFRRDAAERTASFLPHSSPCSTRHPVRPTGAPGSPLGASAFGTR